MPLPLERTLAIFKPDAIKRTIAGQMLSLIEQNGLSIVALKMMKLSIPDVECFYSIHKGKPFYNDLITFMSSGRILVMVLEGDQAISRYRTLMGTTDPAKAADGTIRKLFATAANRNTCHGSDSPQTAQEEIRYFFTEKELFSTE